MREANDNEDYKIVITSCNLYIPVAQVSASVYNELNSLITSKSIALNFRRTEVRLLAIPREKEEFNSDNLFPNDVPCRVIFCFVEEKARKGDYSKSPFEFRRSWTVESLGTEETLSKEEILEKEIQELREKFKILEKRLLEDERPAERRESTSFLSRVLRSSDHREQCESESETPPPYQTEDPITKKKTVWIRKVELTLNGAPLDQVQSQNNHKACA